MVPRIPTGVEIDIPYADRSTVRSYGFCWWYVYPSIFYIIAVKATLHT